MINNLEEQFKNNKINSEISAKNFLPTLNQNYNAFQNLNYNNEKYQPIQYHFQNNYTVNYDQGNNSANSINNFPFPSNANSSIQGKFF